MEPIPWWKSPTLRYNVLAALPTVALILKLVFKVDLTALANEETAGYIAAIVAAVGGLIGTVGVAVRRVQKGKDPADTAVPIKAAVL